MQTFKRLSFQIHKHFASIVSKLNSISKICIIFRKFVIQRISLKLKCREVLQAHSVLDLVIYFVPIYRHLHNMKISCIQNQRDSHFDLNQDLQLKLTSLASRMRAFTRSKFGKFFLSNQYQSLHFFSHECQSQDL